mmetsp:Transcript_30630/g.29249  ORF Transcript_30630/g.29249 Transcript_30630/m.29249 type:complete len:199 (+) Transcript_30630:86-682(+)
MARHRTVSMSSSTLIVIFTFCLLYHCYGYHQQQGPLRNRYTGQFISSHGVRIRNNNQLSSFENKKELLSLRLYSKVEDKVGEKVEDLVEGEEIKEPSAFDQVASKGLAGVLAIAAAEAIFWALGVPLASLWVKYTTGEWIDLMSTEGQLQAAGFSFGYGGFATVILQYRVTLFAIPLVPVMEKLVVGPGKKIFWRKIW